MNFFKFVLSKIFALQLILAAVIMAIFCYIVLIWLNVSTNHNEHIVVPDLSKMSLDEVNTLLEDKKLRFEVQDSANYNPDYPRYSVIEQNPATGQLVKENRKIYLVLNPSGYRKIEIPKNIIQHTRRQAEPTLIALGFKIGSITYQPNIAKDMVLEMRYKGKKVSPGDRLMKTSTIDLVLGDGKRGGLNLSGDQ